MEYSIEYPNTDAKDAIVNREITIAYLLRKYESYNLLLLEDGTIPLGNSEEILKCIRFIEEHHETSPKDMSMHVRAIADKEQRYRITFFNKEFRIRFSDERDPIKGADACVEYIQNNTGDRIR